MQTKVFKKTLFGGFNPYAEELDGDWLVRPLSPSLHTGMVYYDGEALREALHTKVSYP